MFMHVFISIKIFSTFRETCVAALFVSKVHKSWLTIHQLPLLIFKLNYKNIFSVPPSTGTSHAPSLPVHSKKQETLKAQDKKQKRDQECQKHSNTFQNFQPARKVTDSVPNTKKKRAKQASKLLENSSLQKSALAKHSESAVKDSSQLHQSSCLHNYTGSHSKLSTQCSHHSQKSGHVCNNKHSQNHSNVVQESNMHHCSVIHKSASQSQYSQAFLSQPGPELSLKERLLWLQKRRHVGLWVQCCRPTCNKWRFLHDIHDPIDVPQEWFCHMNSGNFVQYMSLFKV
jgi:hypothetical protein